jgi:RNA polymerase sigma factor (TIGR02999 family)
MAPSQVDVTRLLKAWGDGDRDALDRLIPLVYDELRRVARRALRAERGEHTLQATALVNEVYLKLVDQRQVRWNDRAHFFAAAAGVMRRILVDHARRSRAAKRGGGNTRVAVDAVEPPSPQSGVDLVVLHDALERLAKLDSRQEHIVALRYFAGLTIEEVAEVLKLSPATIKNEWSLAKAWLFRELKNAGGGDATDG